MTQVLVTGGTGFIGQHLLTRLVERGDRVRCLARSAPQVPLPGVEYVAGDLTAPETLAAAVRGVGIVFHLAGATLARRAADFWLVNAEGTRALAEACARQARPPVVVHVSSLAAAGPTAFDRPLTEECPARPVSDYGRSKLGGEEYVRAVAAHLPVTVLRPPAVFGPGDHYTAKMFRLVRRGLALLPGRTAFQLSWVYVADLVEAMVLAADRGTRLAPVGDAARVADGCYYIALDEHPLVTEAARLAAEAQGVDRVRVIRVPAYLCRFAARVNALRTPLTGRAYWVNPDKIHEALAGCWTCSPDRARRELGFACRTGLAEGFRLALEWYRAHGLL